MKKNIGKDEDIQVEAQRSTRIEKYVDQCYLIACTCSCSIAVYSQRYRRSVVVLLITCVMIVFWRKGNVGWNLSRHLVYKRDLWHGSRLAAFGILEWGETDLPSGSLWWWNWSGGRDRFPMKYIYIYINNTWIEFPPTSGDLYFLVCLVSQFDSPSPKFWKIGHPLSNWPERRIFSGNKFNLVLSGLSFESIDKF